MMVRASNTDFSASYKVPDDQVNMGEVQILPDILPQNSEHKLLETVSSIQNHI